VRFHAPSLVERKKEPEPGTKNQTGNWKLEAGNRLQNPCSRSLNVEIAQFGIRRVGDDGGARVVAAGPALAAGLVLIPPAVGRREERFVRLAVLREARRADADPELQALARARLEEHVVDPLLQLLALVLGFIGAAARQHDDELVARVADADVVGTDRLAQH